LETVSVTNSSATITNYTLKQYWRKFVQTRKSQANTKKNLFHLIAEEKRKTRTLSKTSLEDGFVITTSNNLLAPNDDAHIIVSRKNAKRLEEADQASALANPSSSSRTASRLLTRIANSLRSLTHIGKTNTSSPSHTTNHSKLNVKLNDQQ
jgi:aspartate-semialdehyde dehydrogenase